MKKILILGATGLLGVPLSDFLEREGYNIIRHGHKSKADCQADMREASEARRVFEDVGPDFVVNLIALTDVDECERNPNMAYLMNVRPVENILGAYSESTSFKLVHISTDHVYDGSGPHAEDSVAIKNTYAFSKYCSEHVALRANGCVLRTNFFGKSNTPGRSSITDWIVESLRGQKPLKLFTDVRFNPLSIGTLSEMISLAINNFQSGVFNLGSSGGMSKRDFAVMLADRLGLSIGHAEEMRSTDAGLATYRPTDMRMDSALFERTFKIKLPALPEEINNVSEEYNAET